MGILQSIGRALNAYVSDGDEGRSLDPMDPRFWGAPDTSTMSGENVSPATALQLDVVQAILGRLGDAVSTLPVEVFEHIANDDDADADDRRPAREHPVAKLLRKRPNARQTSAEFFGDLTTHLAFWRNAYAEIVLSADGFTPAILEPIHPNRMLKIERRRDGRIVYTVRRLDNTGQDDFDASEIFHLRRAPLTDDGLRGKYMFETARETFGKAQAVENFGSLYFRNGGSGGGVLEHPHHFKTKEDEDRFLAAWRRGNSGIFRHRDRLLLDGVKYTPFSAKNDEAQFIETLREMALKLCRLWNMPPHLIGILEKSPLSNIEQQSIEFVTLCLTPYLVAWEQALTRDCFVGDEADRYFVEFNVAGLLRGDLGSRWKAYSLGRQWGWLSVNDVHRLENMKGIGPAGDVYLTPLNMNAAGSPAADGTATAAPDGGAKGNPDDLDDDDEVAPGQDPQE